MTENNKFRYCEEENEEFPFPYIQTDDGETIITLYACCKHLNILYDKNEQLKKENAKLQFELKECSNNKLFSRRELEKENEQLKFELNKLSRENKRFKIFIQRLGDIAEENGSLSKCRVKAEIQYFGEQC